MDFIAVSRQGRELVKKYRWGLLILLVGIFLLTFPEKDAVQQEVLTQEPVMAEKSLEEALEEILSLIDGAGKVSVLLAEGSGEEVLYQTDKSGSSDSLRTETVTLTDEERAQSGLVRQVNPPSYRGAIVLCKGADSAAVRLAIIEAVANATGLTTDKISVLKMK